MEEKQHEVTGEAGTGTKGLKLFDITKKTMKVLLLELDELDKHFLDVPASSRIINCKIGDVTERVYYDKLKQDILEQKGVIYPRIKFSYPNKYIGKKTKHEKKMEKKQRTKDKLAPGGKMVVSSDVIDSKKELR